MSASKPDEKMFIHQYVLGGWDRKCLPQDEYDQFDKAVDEYDQFDKAVSDLRKMVSLDAFICNCGQYCLFD